jgi:hypothetical protein
MVLSLFGKYKAMLKFSRELRCIATGISLEAKNDTW